jgi:hypothetical protein
MKNAAHSWISTSFLICILGGGGGIHLGPLGTAATNRPIVPAPGDYDDGEIGGMIGRGNRSTRRKPAPVPLCPPHAARTRTRAAAVGSQRLTAWATARPIYTLKDMSFRKADESLVCSDKTWQLVLTCINMFKNKYNFWVFYRWINILSFYSF